MSKSVKHTAPAQQLTKEQEAIINSNGNIRINAVAGSGKTTTVIEYAASRPAGSRLLYLAFNKSVKLEAIRKFADRNLPQVKVETAHSLAYGHIMRGSNYRVRSQGYKTHEIASLLGLEGHGEKHAEYVIANHINKFLTLFCNSDKAKVQDLNYLDTLTDKKARDFAKRFYSHIEKGTRILLSRMDKGEIEIIHDFYLKKFQLSKPVLSYDYILFDEGQDASAAMLDIFLAQPATRVIVGDTHQQIYGWRYAVNSLSKTDFPTLHLSASFRFRQDIANLAMGVLNLKSLIDDYTPVPITGKGKSTAQKTKATLARTNLGLLLNAIAFITNNRKVKHIYFEGNIHSYTYADDGTSLYDVLNLHNGQHDRIRDKLLQGMKNMDELEEYIEKTEDQQLGMMVELVNEYGSEIHNILQSLKDLHTGDDDRQKAEMVFSTVHRAKGMEYDTVYLVNDFITEKKIKRMKVEQIGNPEPLDISRINEEINLLYVAVTRARYQLHFSEEMVPENTPASPHIIISQPGKEAGAKSLTASSNAESSREQKPTVKQMKERASAVPKNRSVNRAGSKAWTADEDAELRDLYNRGATIPEIATYFDLSKGNIISRLKKLDYLSN